MKYYFAPLEGITGYIYRRAHHMFYPGMDRYYIPFIVPKEKRLLSTKERNDVMPKHNAGMQAVPQIMTNQAEDFLRIAETLYHDYGYKEVNLNLGCPSKTVVSKMRGSGFLALPDRLELFLEEICTRFDAIGMKLSVKTRIGKESPEEFDRLLEIFQKFPLSELIIHPRIQKDFYKNIPDRNAFGKAYRIYETAGWKLCYNGDIFHASDFADIDAEFPGLFAVMMGRGLLINPGLADEIKVRENGGEGKTDQKTAVSGRFLNENAEKAERKRRYLFYRYLLEDYAAVLSGEKDVLFKMKELWSYMSLDFTEPQRYWKRMKKAQKLADFESAVSALCTEGKLCR